MRLAAIMIAAAMAVLCPLAAAAQSQDTPATSAYIVDVTSGAVLLEKSADTALPPASMSKLMTLYMVFEALDQGLISMSDTFRTSKHAASMGGSKMFIREGGLVNVEDLLRGVIVQSGNDAAVALAEALAGTEELFAERMNERAKDLGLANSSFANATGWPDPKQRMSAKDLVKLARLLIEKFPQYYPIFSEQEFTWDGVKQNNRNPLLTLGVGADGLKTGHTEEAGYGLVVSAKRGDRRITMAITGLADKGQRRHEAERLINWAFRAFDTRKLFSAGEGIADAPVWIGSSSTVTLAPERDVIVTAPFGTIEKTELSIQYQGPVPAPIAEGQRIGHVEVTVPDLPPVRIPLVAAHAVDTGGFLTRMLSAGQLLLEPLLPG